MTTDNWASRLRPRVSDNEFRSPQELAYMVICRDCGITWRYACDECAEHFAEYHRGAFEEDHQVVVSPSKDRRDPVRQRGVPRNVQNVRETMNDMAGQDCSGHRRQATGHGQSD